MARKRVRSKEGLSSVVLQSADVRARFRFGGVLRKIGEGVQLIILFLKRLATKYTVLLKRLFFIFCISNLFYMFHKFELFGELLTTFEYMKKCRR